MTTEEWLQRLHERAVDRRVTLTPAEHMELVYDLRTGGTGAVQWVHPNDLPENEKPVRGYDVNPNYKGRWGGLDIYVV